MFDLINDQSETKEIFLENLELCQKLFSELIKEGPCQQIEASWCPGKFNDNPNLGSREVQKKGLVIGSLQDHHHSSLINCVLTIVDLSKTTVEKHVVFATVLG